MSSNSRRRVADSEAAGTDYNAADSSQTLRGDTLEMLKSLLVVILAAAGIGSAVAEPPQTFQQFDAVSQFDQALAAVDAIRGRKRLQCILATASRSLCQCLSQNLPLDTYPRSYPAIAKQEGEYEAMSAPDKIIVRQCVSGAR
jgi:hypothetical protein